MPYNTVSNNAVAYNTTPVLESGSATATGLVNTTESTIASELGASASTTSLATTETGIGSESGTTQSRGVLRLPTDTSYNAGAYNSGVYNTESGGEVAFAFESGGTQSQGSFNTIAQGITEIAGAIVATSNLDVSDSGFGVESGQTTATTALKSQQSAFALESGTVESESSLSASEVILEAIFRIHTRDIDLSFTIERTFEFNEDKRMTEITAIDDTISDETRRLKFTANDANGTKDILGATIEWSLADSDGNVLLSTSDSNVTADIKDAEGGRFDVLVDTLDVDPGVYRQRLKVVDSNGRVTRSNGTYRIREF